MRTHAQFTTARVLSCWTEIFQQTDAVDVVLINYTSQRICKIEHLIPTNNNTVRHIIGCVIRYIFDHLFGSLLLVQQNHKNNIMLVIV